MQLRSNSFTTDNIDVINYYGMPQDFQFWLQRHRIIFPDADGLQIDTCFLAQ